MTKDTPRTDALMEEHDESTPFISPTSGYQELADFARTIERDLAACRAALYSVLTALEIRPVDEAMTTLNAEQLALIARAVVRQAQEATALRVVVRELVEVADLQAQIQAIQDATNLKRPLPPGDFPALWREWTRREPLAWSAARAILQSTGEGEGK